MKRFIQISILSFICITTFGQNDKWIRGFGYAPFTDIGKNLMHSSTDSDKSKPTNVHEGSFYISYFSASFVNQFQLYKIDNNNVIGIHTSPTFRLIISSEGFGGISMPTFLTYNFGLLSTIDTDKDNGFVGGIGLIPQVNNLTSSYKKTVYAEPAIYLGYRYWKNQKVKEISLQVGYMKHKDIELYNYDYNTGFYSPNNEYNGKNNTFSVKLSFVKYFNY